MHYPHYDVLVVRGVVTRNGLKRMLIDNESLVNKLFGSSPRGSPFHEILGGGSSIYLPWYARETFFERAMGYYFDPQLMHEVSY